MLVGVSAGTSGAFTQGSCVGDSGLQCPREGLGEPPCTPTEAVTPDPLHHGSPRRHQPLRVPGCSELPWWSRAEGAANPSMGEGALVPRGALALGVPLGVPP